MGLLSSFWESLAFPFNGDLLQRVAERLPDLGSPPTAPISASLGDFIERQAIIKGEIDNERAPLPDVGSDAEVPCHENGGTVQFSGD